MTVGWNAAEAAVLPVPSRWERVRLALRALLAGIATIGFLTVFLVLRGIDRLAGAIVLRPIPALAPWVVYVWAHVALALLGIGMRRTGAPMRHPGAIVANHASWLDIVVLQRSMRVFFVSKAEVAGWPGIGQIGRVIGTVFIERRPIEARRQTLALHARLASGHKLCIFPEGTSTDGQRVLPFKSSLFGVFFEPDLHARLWVQPVTIVYHPRRGLPPAFYAWWGTMDFAVHLKAVLALSRGGRVDVMFHAPIRAADFDDRKALAAAAESAVRAGFRALSQPAG